VDPSRPNACTVCGRPVVGDDRLCFECREERRDAASPFALNEDGASPPGRVAAPPPAPRPAPPPPPAVPDAEGPEIDFAAAGAESATGTEPAAAPQGAGAASSGGGDEPVPTAEPSRDTERLSLGDATRVWVEERAAAEARASLPAPRRGSRVLTLLLLLGAAVLAFLVLRAIL